MLSVAVRDFSQNTALNDERVIDVLTCSFCFLVALAFRTQLAGQGEVDPICKARLSFMGVFGRFREKVFASSRCNNSRATR